MFKPEMRTSLLKIIPLLLACGVFFQAPAQTEADWEEIKAQSLQLTQLYTQLLHTLSLPELPDSQKEKIIANSFDPEFPRAAFRDASVSVEFDLDAALFQTGSGTFQPLADYLRSFDLFYNGEGTQAPISARTVGCKTFYQDYPGVEVIFELHLPGVDAQGRPYGKALKRIETAALKEGKQWRAYIVGVSHFAGELDGYECRQAPAPAKPFNYWDNSYFGLNFLLYNRAWPSYKNTGLADFGVSLYAPIGGYLFGFSAIDDPDPAPAYVLSQLEQAYQDLIGQGLDIPEPTFSRFQYTGTRFHAGVCLGPFYQIKYLRRIFFTGGLTYLDGISWQEYDADFKGRLLPSYAENKYVVGKRVYNRETRVEGGIALVFPFAHAEMTWHAYQKAFAWKVGFNWPLSGWGRKN
jgi:hypothetical protein